jgi:hypothetical protein
VEVLAASDIKVVAAAEAINNRANTVNMAGSAEDTAEATVVVTVEATAVEAGVETMGITKPTPSPQEKEAESYR